MITSQSQSSNAAQKLQMMAGMSAAMLELARTIDANSSVLAAEDQSLTCEIVSAAEQLCLRLQDAFTGPDLPIDPDGEISRLTRHDLRNKITALQGFSDLLLMGADDPAVRGNLQTLSAQAREFTTLTVSETVMAS